MPLLISPAQCVKTEAPALQLHENHDSRCGL